MSEYLISYGSAGYLGEFCAPSRVQCRRGDRVLVRSRRGLEIGTVLALASDGLQDGQESVGELVRLAAEDDERQAALSADALAGAFDAARALAAELGLPIEVIDTEVISEPHTLIVHYLGQGEFDPRPFVSGLSTRYDAYIELLDLTPPFAKLPIPDEHGEGVCSLCGKPGGGCGGEGGCNSCGSGGGCGSGCSAAAANSFQEDWQSYFAELRGKMEKRFPLATV